MSKKEVVPEEEIQEEKPEEELTELEKWLVETTKQGDVEAAKRAVTRALALEKSLPQIGMLSVLVGPGGMLQSLVSPNLGEDEGMENVEAALLDIQRNILQARRQKKLAQEAPEPK